MAGLLAPPGYQWKDNNGGPLAAGKIYTYVAGTSTETFSYTSQKATSKHPNPVILDIDGRADIWLDSGVSYKIIIKDSAGNTISTTDNVSGIGGISSSGITVTDNVDMNGYDIISNSSRNIDIVPNGTGKTNIYDPVCQNDLDLNGKNIVVTDSTGFIETSTSNEVLIFNAPASSVNYAQVDSSITAEAPKVSAKGDDTNIDLSLVPKGTGVVNVPGTSTSSSEVRLYEDTDNGTNYIGLKAPSSISSNATYTFPDGDGNANDIIRTNGSGTLRFSENCSRDYLGEFTGNSYIDITDVITSEYSIYEISFTGVVCASGGSVYLLVSTDNGDTWESTLMYSATQGLSLTRYLQETNGNYGHLSYTSGVNTASANPGILTLYFPATSGKKTYWTMQNLNDGGASYVDSSAGGFYNSTDAVTAIRISYGLTTGIARIWGIR